MASVTIESLYSPNPSERENYIVTCHSHRIHTVVTASTSVVRRWIYSVRYYHRHHLYAGRLLVGLGVQWNSNTNSTATLQLCVGHRCLIFQLRYAAHSPKVLHRFLSDPDVTFVGLWNYRDEYMLRESDHELRIRRLVDMRHVASALRGCDLQISMERLAEEVLGLAGVEKEERIGRSAWDQKWLSEQQVEYACVDAFISFLLAKTLKAWKWDGMIE